MGIALNVLIATGKMPRLNGMLIIEFPEALIFTAATVLECCMQLGLIPTNTDYGRLFRHFSISAQITDRKGKTVFSSSSAVPLTREQFSAQSGTRIGEHSILQKMAIPGGFGFWQEDMTQLDRLNDELAEAKEALAQEAELNRLRNELKERQTKTEQRTLVYDAIARRTQRQSQAISRLAKTALLASDTAVKDACRKQITLLGAYIKRYANLMLLSREKSAIEAGELGISVSEVLHYLNLYGVPGEIFSSADCPVPASAALKAFEAFGTLLEENCVCLHGLFVNLSENENVKLKMAFENLEKPLSDDAAEELARVGILSEVKREDDVTYICLVLPKGGEAA